MSTVVNTIAERAGYQADERAMLADLGIDLGDEPPCRECGCSDSLACPQGCGWAQPDLCSVCAAEVEALADAVGDPIQRGRAAVAAGAATADGRARLAELGVGVEVR